MSRKRYLIIGDGAAGTTAAQYIRQGDPQGVIAIYSDDPHPAYFRAALTNYLLGELREDQIWAVPPTFYAELSINRVLARVAGIDAARSQLWLTSGGRPETYDYLMVASGSRARPPSFEGAFLPGVMTMRTLQDVRRVLDLIKLYGLRRAVVLGGGPLGLEWALGLRARGVHVTIVMREARFLPSALDGVSSDLLLARLRQAGVEVRPGEELRAAMPGPDGRVGAVMTKSGETIPCELVAVAIGVICNSDFLQGQLALGKSAGIVVDDKLRTSVPNVFAAGDVAEFGGKLLQLWEPARHQGRAAAIHMTGGSSPYAPGAHYFATRLYDLDFASIGSIASAPGAEELVEYPRKTGHIAYKKLVLKDGRIVGALMLGEREEKVRQRGKLFKRLIDDKVDVTAIKGQIFDPIFDLYGWLQSNVAPRPVARGTSSVPAQGKIKGTHLLSLADLPPPTRASPGAAPAGLPTNAKMKGTQFFQAPFSQAPSAPAASGAAGAALGSTSPLGGPQNVQVLPIGLHAALPPVEGAGTPPVSAYLEGAGRRWDLAATVLSIGRDKDSQVQVADPQVSHVHAQITRHGADLYLRDLGSGGGTWVNGAPVVVPHRLRNGDRIRVGGTELVFRTEGGGARPTAPPPSALAQSVAAPPQPHLEVRAGHGLGLAFALTASPVIIGRDPQATIRLDDYSVSWRHAQLVDRGGRWFVSDTDSAGGTWVNGARLARGQEVPLDEGTQLRLGDATLAYTMHPRRLQALHSPESLVAEPNLAGQVAQAVRSQPPPRMRRARVCVRSGQAPGPVAEIADVIVIGSRQGACNMLVLDPTVHPQHVELSRRPDGIYARDLARATYLRGQPLLAPTRLATGDVLMLSPHISVLFEEEP